ncbi:hypothetical protein OC845_001900 [Tilletia horrida]|nr:hypothetical protein OC845_001900 [Tilletia horrida]
MATALPIRQSCRCCAVEAAAWISSPLVTKTRHNVSSRVRKIATTPRPAHSARSISFLSSAPPFSDLSESSPSHRSQLMQLLTSTLQADESHRPREKETKEGSIAGANGGLSQLLRREIASKNHEVEYDPARTYEARTLYESYKEYVQLGVPQDQVSLPLGATSEREGSDVLPDRIDSELILPLLRAYSRSFIPDLPRAFSLYADVLEGGTIGSPSTQAADVQMYVILLELCVRHRLFARAIRLIRDMTLFGIERLFQTGASKALTANIDELDFAGSRNLSDTLPALFITPGDRLYLLTTMMQSASSYAEAYGIYWRLRRIWTGIQAEAIHRRLRGPSPQHEYHRGEPGSSLMHWIRRIASRSDAHTYLGSGIDHAGMPDTSKDALAYWSQGFPEVLDEQSMANESVLLTEEELLGDDNQAEAFQSSRFNLTSILGRLQSRRNATAAAAAITAKMTIYATPEERAARLSASPFNAEDWKYILSAFLSLPCGQVQAYQLSPPGPSFSRRPLKKSSSPSATTLTKQVWIPAPPELVTSIFWDMLQAGVSPPPQVYTELLHYYTRLLKVPRQRNAATDQRAGSHIPRAGGEDENLKRDRELAQIEDRQRHFLATEAIASIHKLIYLDVNLEPDLPLINALMNAYGHLGQLDQVMPIWQSLVNLSGGGRSSLYDHADGEGRIPSEKSPLVSNRMDAQSVSIVLDACAFASAPGALTRARKVVGWVRHRDRLVFSQARRNHADSSKARSPVALMSKGAWDTWLECLCRRGQLREAIHVLKEEMIPILAEQRKLLREYPSASGQANAQDEPDAKTLGTLLRFAARDRDAAASSKPKADIARSGNSKHESPEERGGIDFVGGSFLGSASSTLNNHDAPSNATPRRREASLYQDLRVWIQKEFPHVWVEVKDIGAT